MPALPCHEREVEHVLVQQYGLAMASFSLRGSPLTEAEYAVESTGLSCAPLGAEPHHCSPAAAQLPEQLLGRLSMTNED